MKKIKILMCAPTYFAVNYEINPWMDQSNKVDPDAADKQWKNLKEVFEKYAEVVTMPSEPGVPDLVFTANAAVVVGNKAVVARYRFPQRQLEEPFNVKWFSDQGFDVIEPPKDTHLEGAGDALIDRNNGELWGAYGPRSSVDGLDFLEKELDQKVHKLELVDPRYYHIDTAFCPLTGGYLMYFPGAFTKDSNEQIEAYFPSDKLLAVTAEEAATFTCNAVDLGEAVALAPTTQRVKDKLQSWGFKTHEVVLSEFLKSGGSAKCLSLRITEN